MLAAYWHTSNEVGTFTAICPGGEIEKILREATTVNGGAQGRQSPGQEERITYPATLEGLTDLLSGA